MQHYTLRPFPEYTEVGAVSIGTSTTTLGTVSVAGCAQPTEGRPLCSAWQLNESHLRTEHPDTYEELFGYTYGDY